MCLHQFGVFCRKVAVLRLKQFSRPPIGLKSNASSSLKEYTSSGAAKPVRSGHRPLYSLAPAYQNATMMSSSSALNE